MKSEIKKFIFKVVESRLNSCNDEPSKTKKFTKVTGKSVSYFPKSRIIHREPFNPELSSRLI